MDVTVQRLRAGGAFGVDCSLELPRVGDSAFNSPPDVQGGRGFDDRQQTIVGGVSKLAITARPPLELLHLTQIRLFLHLYISLPYPPTRALVSFARPALCSPCIHFRSHALYPFESSSAHVGVS